jgi:hypothetical protein
MEEPGMNPFQSIPTRRSFGRRAAAIGGALLVAALAAGAASPVLAVNGGACKAPYNLDLQPSSFMDGSGNPNAIDNAYFPLTPGTTWTYEGEKEGASLVDVMTVTADTRTIMGVTVLVVRDSAWEDGILAEDTFDWYAQDDSGNVWYFGEDTRELDENGNVITTEGSWEAGQGPNLPGILMKAHPRSGKTYRQEFGPGVAIDMATVLSVHRHITVPADTYANVVLTKEYSCLEKGVDHKWYAPGVGLIAELALANGQEFIKLVSVTH